MVVLAQAGVIVNLPRGEGLRGNVLTPDVHRRRESPVGGDAAGYARGEAGHRGCRRFRDIRTAVELETEFGLKVLIAGGAEAWKVAGLLKEKNVGVLYDGTFALRGAVRTITISRSVHPRS